MQTRYEISIEIGMKSVLLSMRTYRHPFQDDVVGLLMVEKQKYPEF